MSFRVKTAALSLVAAAYVVFLYWYGYGLIGGFNIDFQSFYATAKVTFERGNSPYVAGALSDDEALLGEKAPAIPFGTASIKLGQYLYPPPSLLLFFPLTFFSFPTAKVMMLVINHVCLLLSLYLLLAERRHPEKPQNLREIYAAVACCLFALAYFPIVVVLSDGQVNLIVLTCLLLAWVAWQKDSHPSLIAWPLAVAVLLKTYPILLVPLLLMRRQYAATLWLGVLLAAAAAISFIVLPAGVWHDWFVNVVPTGGYGKTPFNLFSPAQPRNYNINGFATRLFMPNGFTEPVFLKPQLAPLVAYLLASIVGAVTLAVSLLSARRTETRRVGYDELSLFLLMMMLVAPLTWESHLVFALPAAFTTIYVIIVAKDAYFRRAILAGCVALLAWNLQVDSPAFATGFWRLLIPTKFYVLVILWAFFVARLLRASLRAQQSRALAPSPA